jgi:cytochrome c5
MFFASLTAGVENSDRSEELYKTFCVSCHGEQVEKIPLNPESTQEYRISVVSNGAKEMPSYSWFLNKEEAKKLVEFMEKK